MWKIVFIRLYDFLIDPGYLYKFQSSFRPGDSTVNQLAYLVHQVYLALDTGKEVRLVFLDILSKAFDKVWHDGLICKLESLCFCNPLLNWLRSYLGNTKQQVLLEGGSSGWKSIDSGIPQGSVLGPLLFLFTLMIWLIISPLCRSSMQTIQHFWKLLMIRYFLRAFRI